MKKIERPNEVAAPVLEPAKQLLWDAADEIARRGLCQGAPYGGSIVTGSLCTMSAICDVAMRTSGLGNRSEVIRAAEDYLTKAICVDNYVRWSDASDQATVVSALRAAALS